MEKQEVTLEINDDILKAAEKYALEHNTTIEELVNTHLVAWIEEMEKSNS